MTRLAQDGPGWQGRYGSTYHCHLTAYLTA
jgi:hypothetical protein